ncbi:hypothetical protein DINM_003387 [Dirofilaria immitis]|nr:hypothetical protein [Dirofilaria immitis]
MGNPLFLQESCLNFDVTCRRFIRIPVNIIIIIIAIAMIFIISTACNASIAIIPLDTTVIAGSSSSHINTLVEAYGQFNRTDFTLVSHRLHALQDGLKIAHVEALTTAENERRTRNGKFTLGQLRQTDGLVPLQSGTNQFDSQKGKTGFGMPCNTALNRGMTGFGTPRDVRGKHLKRLWELEFPEDTVEVTPQINPPVSATLPNFSKQPPDTPPKPISH